MAIAKVSRFGLIEQTREFNKFTSCLRYLVIKFLQPLSGFQAPAKREKTSQGIEEMTALGKTRFTFMLCYINLVFKWAC